MSYDKSQDSMSKLFIGGLDARTSDESLKAHFEQFGEITDVIVMKDSETQRSRGFGFVTFAESSMVDDALQQLPHNIDGRDVDAKRAVPRDQSRSAGRGGDGGRSKRLFIGGTKDLSEDEIREAFSQFGDVTSVSVPTDRETHKNRGFAFVEFADFDAAEKAVRQERLFITDTEVDIKKPREKNDMGGRGGRGGGGRGGGRGGYGGRGDSRGGQSYGSSGGYGSQGGYGGSNGGGYGGSNGGGYGGSSGGYSGSNGGYGGQSGGYGGQSGGYGGQSSGYGSQSGGYGQDSSSGYGSYNQSSGGGPTRSYGQSGGNRSAPYSGGSSYGGSSNSGYSRDSARY